MKRPLLPPFTSNTFVLAVWLKGSKALKFSTKETMEAIMRTVQEPVASFGKILWLKMQPIFKDSLRLKSRLPQRRMNINMLVGRRRTSSDQYLIIVIISWIFSCLTGPAKNGPWNRLKDYYAEVGRIIRNSYGKNSKDMVRVPLYVPTRPVKCSKQMHSTVRKTFLRHIFSIPGGKVLLC